MNELTRAVYTHLISDPVISAALSDYGGRPAVFTIDPAPGNADFMYIVTAGDVTDMPFDTKTCLGREIVRDVRVYASKDASPGPIENLAEAVRTSFHRKALAVDGHSWLITDVMGPIEANEVDAQGRIVSVTFKLLEV